VVPVLLYAAFGGNAMHSQGAEFDALNEAKEFPLFLLREEVRRKEQAGGQRAGRLSGCHDL
jgi:hypothetical protein